MGNNVGGKLAKIQPKNNQTKKINVPGMEIDQGIIQK
jgi:hypothetical protein